MWSAFGLSYSQSDQTTNREQHIDTCVILPVKAFSRAKSRLGSVLNGAQRTTLARLMAIDVLRSLRAATGVRRILVAGQDDEHADLAANFGCEYVVDDPAKDVSANVASATGIPFVLESKAVLIVPSDIPQLRAADIDALLAKDKGGVTICRAMRDGGTNAMLVSPPREMMFSFGSNSSERHAAAAKSAGQQVTILDDIGFGRDIDTAEDLAWLCRYGRSGETVAYLKNSGLVARLVESLPESIAS